MLIFVSSTVSCNNPVATDGPSSLISVNNFATWIGCSKKGAPEALICLKCAFLLNSYAFNIWSLFI